MRLSSMPAKTAVAAVGVAVVAALLAGPSGARPDNRPDNRPGQSASGQSDRPAPGRPNTPNNSNTPNNPNNPGGSSADPSPFEQVRPGRPESSPRPPNQTDAQGESQRPSGPPNVRPDATNPSNGQGSSDVAPNADRRTNAQAVAAAAAGDRRFLARPLLNRLVNTAEDEGSELYECVDDVLAQRVPVNGAAAAKSQDRPARSNAANRPPKGVTSPDTLDCDDTGVASPFLVEFIPGASAAREVSEARNRRMGVSHVFGNVFSGMAVWATARQLRVLKRNPNVRRVLPDGLVQSSSSTQNGATWGLDRSDQRALPLDQTYRYTASGSGIQAYVVDTGVRADHAELTGRVSSGYSSIGGGTSDCNGHGTHVAGTIGANLYGVAKAVTIVPVRVLDCAGSGTWSGVIAGLDWIAGAGSPATSVVNMSLGGGTNSLADDAVRNLANRGFSVVVAAGNSNADACRYSPAGVQEAITVGATDSSDNRASYSNFGNCLDLFAPGTSITSLWHTSSSATTTLSGTSMASPHVAGAVALLLQSGPASPAAISERLKNLATAGVVGQAGNGSPNLLLFTLADGDAPVDEPREEEPSEDPPTVVLPSQPSGVVAAAGSKSAFVSWSAPADTGGTELTGYTVNAFERMKNGRIRSAGSVSIDAGTTDLRVTDLRKGSTYRFTVAATNSVGTGPQSDPSNWVTPTR